MDKDDRTMLGMIVGGGLLALVIAVVFYGALIYFAVWAVKQIWGG